MEPLVHKGSLRPPTPVASARAHLLAAAGMWMLAGLGLCIAGGLWVGEAHSSWALPLLLLAALVGLFKARLVLDRAADRIVRRIRERGDGRCLGGFLSWKSWLVVAGMVVLGRLLRASPLPLLARGAIYCAIGVALLAACRRIWASWWRVRVLPPL